MARLALVSAVLAVAACGSKPASTTPTPGSGAQPTGEFPVGPPLVTPGERMTYRVELRGIELAAMTIGVGEIAEVAGTQAVVVQGHARSVGLANLVAAIDDTFTSWIDVATGRPLRFQVDEYETNSTTNIEHTIIDIAGRANDLLPITFGLNDATPQPEPQKVSLPEIWDYNSFLVSLRAWEGPIGTKKELQVFRSRYLWNVTVTIASKGKLTTELGELPAVRFDAHAYKYTRELTKYPATDERDFSVWISNDGDRVPLQLNAKTDYGDVKMMIVDYQPGTGARLRP